MFLLLIGEVGGFWVLIIWFLVLCVVNLLVIVMVFFMRFLFEDDIGLILVCFRGLGFGVSRFVFFEEMEKVVCRECWYINYLRNMYMKSNL